jgi:predicted metal-dependent HD superfamily phosphohydrolase
LILATRHDASPATADASTEAFRATFEETARANLSRSIRALDA